MIQFAYATDGTTAAGAGNMTSTIIMIVVMIAIFYFLLIRPENKRKKQAEEMRNSLKKGDWLTTIGGIYGRVVAITDRTDGHRDQRGSGPHGVRQVRHRFCGYAGSADGRCPAARQEVQG